MKKEYTETVKLKTVKTYLQGIKHAHSIQELCVNQNTGKFDFLLRERICEIIDYAFKTKSACSSSYWPVVDYVKKNNKTIINEKHGETNCEIYGYALPVRIRTEDYIPEEKSQFFLDIVAKLNRNTIDNKQCAVEIYNTILDTLRKGISQSTDRELMEFAKTERYSDKPEVKTLANIITLSDNKYQDKLASYMSDLIYINFENDKLNTSWEENQAYVELVKLYNVYNVFHNYTPNMLEEAIAEYNSFGLDYNKFKNILNTGVSELESKLGLVLSDSQYNAWQQHGIGIRSHIWIHDCTI